VPHIPLQQTENAGYIEMREQITIKNFDMTKEFVRVVLHFVMYINFNLSNIYTEKENS
jgi:hypothetical protein